MTRNYQRQEYQIQSWKIKPSVSFPPESSLDSNDLHIKKNNERKDVADKNYKKYD